MNRNERNTRPRTNRRGIATQEQGKRAKQVGEAIRGNEGAFKLLSWARREGIGYEIGEAIPPTGGNMRQLRARRREENACTFRRWGRGGGLWAKLGGLEIKLGTACGACQLAVLLWLGRFGPASPRASLP